MKKLFLLITLIGAIIFTSCGSKKPTAEDFLKDANKYLEKEPLSQKYIKVVTWGKVVEEDPSCKECYYIVFLQNDYGAVEVVGFNKDAKMTEYYCNTPCFEIKTGNVYLINSINDTAQLIIHGTHPGVDASKYIKFERIE